MSHVTGRDGKMYERASNARVNFFIVWVKSVTNSMLFCRESELCCDFGLFGASTLFCRKFTFVVIYAPIMGKIVLAQSLLV